MRYLPFVVLVALEFVLAVLFSESVWIAPALLAAFGALLALVIRRKILRMSLSVACALVAVGLAWQCGPVPAAWPVAVLAGIQLVQISGLFLMRHVPSAVGDVRAMFMILGLVSAYLACRNPGDILSVLYAGILGTLLLVVALLQSDDCLLRFVTLNKRKGAEASWAKAGMLLVMIALAFTMAGLAAPWMTPVSERLRSLARIVFRSSGVNDQAEAAKEGRAKGKQARLLTSPWEVGPLRLRSRYDQRVPHRPKIQLLFHEQENASPAPSWLYLRCAAYDKFSGSEWTATVGRREILRDVDDGRRDGMIRVLKENPRPMRYTVCLKSSGSGLLPGIPTVACFEQRAVERGGNDVFFAPVPVPSGVPFSYTMRSSTIRWDDLRPADRIVDDVDSRYAALPEDAVTARVAELARRVVGESADADVKVRRLSEHLRTGYEYSQRVRNERGLHPVENFLFHEKKGNCELFAASLTLMLRAVGIPARLVAGYAGGEIDTDSGVCVFYEDNGHAWVEIPVADCGWVTVEATPEGPLSAPTAPKVVSGNATWAPDDFVPLSSMVNKIYPERESDWSIRAMPGWRRFLNRWSPSTLAGCVLLVGVVLVMALWQALMGRQRLTELLRGALTANPPGFFSLFCRHFERRGCPLRKGQTALEYLNALKRNELIGSECDELVTYFCEVTYGRKLRSPSREKEFQRLVRSLRRE